MKSLSLPQISAAHELKFIIVATRKLLKISAKRYVKNVLASSTAFYKP